MAAVIRQFHDTANTIKTSETGLSAAFSTTTLSGSALIIISAFSNDVGDISGITCTDPVGNTYTRIVDVADTTSSGDERFQMWYCPSALPLTSSQPITVNYFYTDYAELLIFEVTGLTSTPFIAANGTYQSSISGGTNNNLTTGNIASGTGTVFFIGGSMNSLELGTGPFYPTVGTGLTQGGLWFIDPLDTGATGNAAALATWGYGTFTSPGTTSYHFTAPSGASGTSFVTFGATFAVSGSATALSITTTSPLTSGTVGSAYSFTLSATGGTSPYAWSITTGTLPSGLSLSSSGVISGTPSVATTVSITVKVTDSASTAALATLSITTNSAAVPLSITTTSPLPAGIVGTAYSTTFAVTGGTSPYTWSLSSGSFPGGLSFSSVGLLSGTPSTSGTFSATVKITDNTGASTTSTFSITISPATSISTLSLPTATTSVTYSTTLAAAGGTAPYTWTITSGTLPSGFSLSTSGVITGISNTPSSTSIIITVTDSRSTSAARTFTFAVQYAPSQGSALVWWFV